MDLSKLFLGLAAASSITIGSLLSSFNISNEKVDTVVETISSTIDTVTEEEAIFSVSPMETSYYQNIEKPERSFPKKTHAWFTTAYTFPSNWLHALPGMYRVSPLGLEFSGLIAESKEKAVITQFGNECLLEFPQAFTRTEVDSYGDWHVVLSAYDQQNQQTSFTITQGSPQVSIQTTQMVTIGCDGLVEPVTNGAIVSKNGQSYLLQAEVIKDINYNRDSISISSETGELRLLVLPEDFRQDISFYTALPWARVTETIVSNNDGETTFHILTNTSSAVLATVWPHQQRFLEYLPAKQLGSYETALGTLETYLTHGFTVNFPQHQLREYYLPVEEETNRAELMVQIKKDTEQILNEGVPAGVYFKGTHMGVMVELATLADQYHLVGERDRLLDKAIEITEEQLSQVSYKQESGMLLANNPEFGHEHGNDHHFHYGYYIRAAARIHALRPEWLTDENKNIINQMIVEIASTNRNTDTAPYLRHFGLYEGHSFADGRGIFNDGNNQESTSEALHAWYGIWLWGQQMQNQDHIQTGQWLFDHELAATQSYWFGIDNPFGDDYISSMASIVWHAKRDYTTWFSPEDLHIFGIQWLPLSPVSNYFEVIDNYNDHKNFLTATLGPDLFTHEWSDLWIAYAAHHELDYAKENLAKVRDKKGAKLQSLLLQTVFELEESN